MTAVTMADEIVWMSLSTDPVTKDRARKMAESEMRSVSQFLSILVNREWDRRQESVSVETQPKPEEAA
jgi:ferritin-like protein